MGVVKKVSRRELMTDAENLLVEAEFGSPFEAPSNGEGGGKRARTV
jgi:hypothetical protein